MIYILIALSLGVNNGGHVTVIDKYQSQIACQHAAKSFNTGRPGSQAEAFCVESPK
jgi:hypothetical protein